MINYCETCKYRNDKKSEKRCLDCSKGNLLNWEPAEEKQETGNCNNCRYGDLDIDEKPCNECILIGPKRTMWEPEKAKQKKRERPAMLGKPLPKYERESSRIPDQIRVSFSDGSTAIYDLRVDQPAPFVESIKIIRKWKQGYVNQPARRRNKK